MNIGLVKTTKEIELCFPVMVQLRTELSKKEFIEKVKRQRKSGYQLAFLEDKNKIVALVGFRILEKLAFGKLLYVDDLVTDAKNRSKGYGDKLFDWIVKFGKKENCNSIMLDSGVQKGEAHRFYFKKRMAIYCYLFGLALK